MVETKKLNGNGEEEKERTTIDILKIGLTYIRIPKRGYIN